jgi:glycosyltransferase involved in cell wall biosynthesis
MVHRSQVVITICQELQDTVTEMGVGERSLLIENVMGGDVDEAPSKPTSGIRTAWGIAPDAPLALYTGTFEAYQGVEMLIDAAAILARTRPSARVLVVGGEPQQGRCAGWCRAGRGGRHDLSPPAPAKEIPGFVQAADLPSLPSAAPTRRSRSIRTCGPASRSWPRTC